MTIIRLTVDARGMASRFLPPGDVSKLVDLWHDFEPHLRGYTLEAGQVLPAEPRDSQGPLGTLKFQVEYPRSAQVDETTQFEIVSILERPRIAAIYRCATCQREENVTYGPFVCNGCPSHAARVCDNHVLLLPGSLTGRCPGHTPICSCGQRAVAWCPGPQCRGGVAWCVTHLVSHAGRDHEVKYCQVCYSTRFPACSRQGCHEVGSMRCQWVDDRGRSCAQNVCPRDATLWQVFGPARPGLVRCSEHSAVLAQRPDEMVYQILAHSVLQRKLKHTRSSRDEIPSLGGFRYILAKPGRINPTVAEALAHVTQSAARAPALRKDIEAIVFRNHAQWRKFVEATEGAQNAAFERLINWIRSNGDQRALPTLASKGWVRARDDRPAALIISVDARFFPAARRTMAEQSLGFTIIARREP